MKSRIGLAVALSLAFGVAHAQPAVRINGTEIPRQKVQMQTDHLVNERGQGSGGITQPSEYKRFQREVVDQLIIQELLWQEAQRRNFVVSDEVVDQRLADVKGKFESEQAFLFKIKEGGFNEASFREDIRQQTSVQRMIADGIAPTIDVSDAEIKEFYGSHLDRMQIPLELHARHILIQPKSSSEDDLAAARAEIGDVLSELRSGADFVAVAKRRSQATSAGQGGDLGFFTPDQMVDSFRDAVLELSPGDISGVVETEFGFHVIKLEERRGGGTASLEEASDQIRDFLKQEHLERTVEELVTQLRDKGDVQIFLDL